jgi:hypothetical protein
MVLDRTIMGVLAFAALIEGLTGAAVVTVLGRLLGSLIAAPIRRHMAMSRPAR